MRPTLLLAAGAFVIVNSAAQIGYAIAFVFIAWGLAIHPYRSLVNRWIGGIGVVSYSAYMWHFAILDRLSPKVIALVHPTGSPKWNASLQFVALYAGVIALTLVVATASHHLIERPGQRVGKSIIDRMGWGSAR